MTQGPDGLDANHIPFEFESGFGSGGRLIGHVARANPVWSEAKDNATAKRDVLVIFAQQLIERGQAVGQSMLDIDKGIEKDQPGT